MKDISRRPAGYIVVVVITGVDALLSFGIGNPVLDYGSVGDDPSGGQWIGIFCYVFGLIAAVICVGLWTLQSWALKWARVYYVILIIILVLSLFLIPFTPVATFLFLIGLYAWTLSYLRRLSFSPDYGVSVKDSPVRYREDWGMSPQSRDPLRG